MAMALLYLVKEEGGKGWRIISRKPQITGEDTKIYTSRVEAARVMSERRRARTGAPPTAPWNTAENKKRAGAWREEKTEITTIEEPTTIETPETARKETPVMNKIAGATNAQQHLIERIKKAGGSFIRETRGSGRKSYSGLDDGPVDGMCVQGLTSRGILSISAPKDNDGVKTEKITLNEEKLGSLAKVPKPKKEKAEKAPKAPKAPKAEKAQKSGPLVGTLAGSTTKHVIIDGKPKCRKNSDKAFKVQIVRDGSADCGRCVKGGKDE